MPLITSLYFCLLIHFQKNVEFNFVYLLSKTNYAYLIYIIYFFTQTKPVCFCLLTFSYRNKSNYFCLFTFLFN